MKRIVVGLSFAVVCIVFQGVAQETVKLAPIEGVSSGESRNVADSPSPSGLIRVRAKGVGTTKIHALKDAFHDAIERAVGLFVDAEQMVKNDKLVKDQILTHSNAYIEKYDVMIEQVKPNGLFAVEIMAMVKKGDLTQKMRDVMGESVVKDLSEVSKDLHAKIVTEGKMKEDALTLLRNELKDLSPVKQLIKASLGSVKPVVESVPEDSSMVRLWYPINFAVDTKKYYEEFAPRMERIFGQIKTSPAKRFDLKNEVKYANAYKEWITQKYGTSRKLLPGVMTRSDKARNWEQEYISSDFRYYGLALNEEYRGVTFLATRIFGNPYVLSGLVCEHNKGSIWTTSHREMEYNNAPLVRRDFVVLNYNMCIGWPSVPVDCKFGIGIVQAASSYTLSGQIYTIPPYCVQEIVEWQKALLGVSDQDSYGSCYGVMATKVEYELSFLDSSKNEIIGTSFSVRNIDLANTAFAVLESSERTSQEGVFAKGKFLWYISPLVGGFAKSYVKWVSVDVAKDDVAKMTSATIKVQD